MYCFLVKRPKIEKKIAQKFAFVHFFYYLCSCKQEMLFGKRAGKTVTDDS